MNVRSLSRTQRTEHAPESDSGAEVRDRLFYFVIFRLSLPKVSVTVNIYRFINDYCMYSRVYQRLTSRVSAGLCVYCK